jgi:hypothetical protein
MRPDPPTVLRAATRSLGELAAVQATDQDAFRLRGLMSLLAMLEQEWDTGAARRVAGISRYAALVRRGAELVPDAQREHLRQALVGTETPDLRISALEATLDRLRAAVIDLQGWLEDAELPAERELLTALWQAEYEDAKSEDRNSSFW